MSSPAARKVVYISVLPPDGSGVAAYGSHVARSLAKLPSIERVDVLSNAVPGVPSHEVWSDKLAIDRCWRLNDTKSILALALRVRRMRPDVVHVNCGIRTWGTARIPNFAAAMLIPLLRTSGARVVVTIHTVAETVSREIFKEELSLFTRAGIHVAERAYLAADVVTVPLKSMQRSLEQAYGAKNVVHVPHGCYELRNGGHVVSGGHRVLTLGYWGKYKNPEVVVKAVTALRRRGLPIELVVAGGVHPYYPTIYKSIVDRYRHLDYVRFTGFVPDDELDSLFLGSAVMVLPYQGNAGASGVLNLTRSFGKPVIISDEEALVEQHRDEGGGHIVFHNEDELSVALERVLSDEALQRKMGEENLAVAQALSIDRIAARMAEQY